MMSSVHSPLPPPPHTRPPFKPSTLFGFLASLVFVVGVGGSAVLAFWWPLIRFDDTMDLNVVVTELAADDSVFNFPLFMLGAGPSLVATAVLLAASNVIDELRRLRAGV